MPLPPTTRNAVLVLIGEAATVRTNQLHMWMEQLEYSRRASMKAVSDLVISGFAWSRHGKLRLRPAGRKMYEGHVKETGET